MPRMRRPRECDSNAARESDSHARLVRRASVPWGSSARGNMREKTRRAFASTCASSTARGGGARRRWRRGLARGTRHRPRHDRAASAIAMSRDRYRDR